MNVCVHHSTHTPTPTPSPTLTHALSLPYVTNARQKDGYSWNR